MSGFRKATKQKKKLVMSIQGASGSGKTYSALNIAKHLCRPGKRVAFIDTERSADLYANKFDFDVDDDFGKFGALNYHPDVWMKKLHAAANEKDENGECIYDVVVMDSLTHFWKGDGGMLQTVANIERAAKAAGKRMDSHAAWKEVDPIYSKFMNSLRHLPFHVLFCVRCKQDTERVMEGGRTTIKKLGLAPEFRDGFDYDVDAQMVIDEEHVMVPRKHRLEEYLDGKIFPKPGQDLAEVLKAWSEDGKDRTETPRTDPPPAPTGSEPKIRLPDVGEEVSAGFIERLKAADSMDTLKAISAEANKAKADGKIAGGPWKALLAAFSEQAKQLQTAAA